MTSEREPYEELVINKMREVYSEAVVDHALNPRNLGEMEESDGHAKMSRSCGDTMEIWLKVNDGIIVDSAFMTSGCSTMVAAGSMATELGKGKRLGAAYGTTEEDILDALGGLPPDSHHCATLAANTLKAAIKDYLDTKNQPWKKAYRKK